MFRSQCERWPAESFLIDLIHCSSGSIRSVAKTPASAVVSACSLVRVLVSGTVMPPARGLVLAGAFTVMQCNITRTSCVGEIFSAWAG